MPTFSTVLPTQQAHQGFDLRRTPPNKPMTAICTAENILVCDTHYWRGRTLPCERETNEEGKTIDVSHCPACEAKQAYRTHVYVSCFDRNTHEHFIFECTANAAKPFQEYVQATGSLRGCLFQATRPKGGPNSKVVIVTNTANLAKNPIPAAPDVALCLAVIWRLPRSGFSIPDQPFAPPALKPDRKTLATARNQPDDVGGPVALAEILGANGRSKRKD